MEQFLRSILFVNLHVAVAWGVVSLLFDTLSVVFLKLRKNLMLISFYIYI